MAAETLTATASISVTGMGVMGRNLARNFACNGYKVAIHSRTYAKTEAVMDQFGEEARSFQLKALPTSWRH